MVFRLSLSSRWSDTKVVINYRSSSAILLKRTPMPYDMSSSSMQWMFDLITSTSASRERCSSGTLCKARENLSLTLRDCRQHMKAPPALTSIVMPVTTPWVVSRVTGQCAMARLCWRLSFSMDAIPALKKAKSKWVSKRY